MHKPPIHEGLDITGIIPQAGLITEKEYEQARGSAMELRPKEKELER